jgi:uncharacterized membrane protein
MMEVQGQIVFLLADGAEAVGGWERFWQLEPERLVLWFTILAILLAIAWYIIGKIRPKAVQKEHTASEWLSKYREMHAQGKLSDEEFRTIKTTLAAQLQDELNGNGDTN